MLSLLLRRVHMYAGLFLAPWILMYAASTFAMNHRPHDRKPPTFERERTETFPGEFAPEATPQQVALQLLAFLDLDGAHNVPRPAADGKLTIQRLDPLHPRRITYQPDTKALIVEKQVFETSAFLERMHRRRGYQHDYWLEDLWAISVDVTIAGIVVWALSGLWLWWELKVTRRIGLLSLAGGVALFALFLKVL
ncbi:MAG: hypothetical protein FJW30_24375 [Acidobacteria bacterium]|nr:hypothetical protein [Acidobacteriota bacterium]